MTDSSAGAAGSSTPGPSCSGLAPTCGPCKDQDCCASSVVPGGTFYRSYDGVTYTDKSNPATVSDFRLDKYEITVGRFRKFVAAYSQDMVAEGAGENPNNPNDPGWSAAWNTDQPTYAPKMAVDAAALTSACPSYKYRTWTDTPGANENLPMNCINWYEAYAFCIWDGGRLPTEAEGNYAAAGGSEQRVYPWSFPPADTTIDRTYAVYCDDACLQAAKRAPPENVGTKSPKGDGRWGQADLVGNISEWTLDWYARAYLNPCTNCMNLSPDPFVDIRTSKSWPKRTAQQHLEVANRTEGTDPFLHDIGLGARCARNP